MQKQARLPGFRKGHVPRSLVKLHFADDVRREVAEHLIPDVYRQALTEARIDPVNEPDLQDCPLEEARRCRSWPWSRSSRPSRSATTRASTSSTRRRRSTDADVDEALERMREQHAEFRSVERAAADGDLVIVDYTLAPDGQEPTRPDGYRLRRAAAPCCRRSTRRWSACTPARSARSSCASPTTTAWRRCAARPAGHRQGRRGQGEDRCPRSTTTSPSRSGEFETLDALRAEVRKQLEARREADERAPRGQGWWRLRSGAHEFAVPDADGDAPGRPPGSSTRASGCAARASIPTAMPWDYQKLIGELRPGAEKAVRRALLLEAIADKEGSR